MYAPASVLCFHVNFCLPVITDWLTCLPCFQRVVEGVDHGPSIVGTASLLADARGLLEDINTSMAADYALRRRMMLERLDLTVQSFLWSDAAKVRDLSHFLVRPAAAFSSEQCLAFPGSSSSSSCIAGS